MNKTTGKAAAKGWTRKSLQRTHPNRRAGGFYRTSDGKAGGIAGVPLGKVDDAVVAAVRMAYRVAEAQIDRSTRLAQRLRDTGDRAVGGDSARNSVDATERLVFRAMMSGLSWLEAAAEEPGSPLLRLVAAEYRLLGTVLGLSSDALKCNTPGASGGADAPAPEPRPAGLEIVHTGKNRRVVRVVRCEIAGVAPRADALAVTFHRAGDAAAAAFDATLTVHAKHAPRLALATPDAGSAGVWRGAVCDEGGLQLGFIEIEI